MLKNNKKFSIKAFSLIEISIVVLIISLLIAGLLQGADLSNKMRLNTARSITENSPILSIDGLKVWYDVVMENSLAIGTSSFVDTKIIDDKQPIGKWNDLNTNILASLRSSAIQATASYQPLYYQRGINNLPALYFDGSDDYIAAQIDNIAGNYFIGIQDSFTYFIVTKPEENCVNSGSSTPGTSGQRYAIYPLQGDVAMAGWNRASVGLSICKNYLAVVEHKNSYMPFMVYFARTTNRPIIVTLKYENRVAYLYINSTLVGTSGASGYFTAPSLSFGGGRPGTPTNYGEHYGYYKGFIGEIILYQNSLADIDRISVENYLKEKWSIK